MRRTTRRQRNVKALREVGRRIERMPRKYEQSSWHCGTKMCVAGFAAELHPEFKKWAEGLEDESIMLKDGSLLHAKIAGQSVLGLSDDEIDILFDGLWEPKKKLGGKGKRVKDALYGLARGLPIQDVTSNLDDLTS